MSVPHLLNKHQTSVPAIVNLALLMSMKFVWWKNLSGFFFCLTDILLIKKTPNKQTSLHMNVFTVLAIFISYWQHSKAMKIQTAQFPREPYSYNNDCWSMKKSHLAKWPSWLPLPHPRLSLTSKSCLLHLLDKHSLLFARADVCLIQHLLLPSQAWGESYCSLYFLSVYNTSALPAKVQKRGRTLVALKIIYPSHKKWFHVLAFPGPSPPPSCIL